MSERRIQREREGEGHIICAHCGARLEGTEKWLEHIPCSKSREGAGKRQRVVAYN